MMNTLSIERPPRRGLFHWVHELDRILRGEATSLSSIRQGMMELPVIGLTVVLLSLAAIYGFCMAWFGLFARPDGAGVRQLFANMIKVPALFLLTLIVTFPSLYVFNALVGSRLTLRTLTRLLVAAMAVILAVLASFGPIVAFFSVTTTSHPFILLLNVFFCSVAGFLGMAFLLQTLHRLTIASDAGAFDEWRLKSQSDTIAAAETETTSTSDRVEATAGTEHDAADAATDETPFTASDMPAEPAGEGPLDAIEGRVLGEHVKTIFRCWVVAFALVGSQMSWVLRPFIGRLDEEFTLFGPRESSFFEAVWKAIQSLF